MNNDQDYLQLAVELARINVAEGGRPFGAVLVKDGQVIAEAVNEIHLDQDPTAHAELLTRATSTSRPEPNSRENTPSGRPVFFYCTGNRMATSSMLSGSFTR